MAWDAALGLDERENSLADTNKHCEGVSAGPITSGGQLLDLIVYPQNMPNTPPVTTLFTCFMNLTTYSVHKLDNANVRPFSL